MWGVDAVLIALVVLAWAALMVGPYRAFRDPEWDFEIAGTAAEWTGGLFTGLTVLLALRAFLQEKRETAEEHARRLVHGVAAYAQTDADGAVDLIIQNESGAPIWDIEFSVSTIRIENNRVTDLFTAGNTLWEGAQLLTGGGVRMRYIAPPGLQPWTPDPSRSITTNLRFTDSARNRWLDVNGILELVETGVEIHPGLGDD